MPQNTNNNPLPSVTSTPNRSSSARLAPAKNDPNMIRCRKCHKWYDRTKACSAKSSMPIYDIEIDWTFSETFTRVYCPHCGYWHR